MLHRILNGLAASLLTLVAPTSPLRAEIRFEQAAETQMGSAFAARLSGDITAEDYGALLGLADQAAAADWRHIQLDSTGGDIAAAMAIGRLMRSMEFDSLVIAGGRCHSACLFVLAAGVNKVVLGEVGMHRPYFPQLAAAEVGPALQAVKAASVAYLDEMNIPTRLVEDMFSIDPAAMHILTLDELGAYRLNSEDHVLREQRAQSSAARYGMSREAYELFRRDLDYSCKIFIRQRAQMTACVNAVAARHGLPM